MIYCTNRLRLINLYLSRETVLLHFFLVLSTCSVDATHCTWVTSEAYSSPSIVLAARGAHGNRVIFYDYREAYFWLWQNTPPDAKVQMPQLMK
ncbi:hypothetical protein CsSME_00039195 [Camellia sinensis var. sinensis]